MGAATTVALLALRVVTLAEAEKQADANQPNNQVAAAQTDLARAQQAEVQAGLLPQASLTGVGGYRYQNSGQGNFGNTGSFSPYYAFGLSVNQLLWDFSTVDRNRAFGRNAEAQRASELATRLLSLQNVRAAFFNARANKAWLAASRVNVENYERHLRQIEGFVRVGSKPEIDLAQARADLASARAQLIGAENDYATARAQLNQAMGVVADTDYDVADDLLGPVAGEESGLESLVEEAIAARPDVVAAEQQVHAQELFISAARGGYLPSFNAGASGQVTGNDPTNPASSLALSINGRWDFFSGGRTGAQVREQRAQLSIQNAQLQALRLQVRTEVEQARLAVRAALATLAALDEALRNAGERLRLADGRYTAGVGNIIELYDAQTAANTANGQRIRAEYNVGVARAQLLRALGRR